MYNESIISTSFVKYLAIFTSLFLAPNLSAQTTNFTGNGDGSSWNQVSNWDNGIPTTDLRAKIRSGQVVEISSAGQVARRIEIEDNGTLSVMAGGMLTITNSDDPAIEIMVSGVLNNSGIILIDSTSSNQGIRMRDSAVINNYAGGQLTINDTEQEGIKTDESFIINYGTITINRPNGDQEGILLDDDGATLDNYGLLVITGDDDTNEAIEMDGDTEFTNHGGATLTISGSTKGIEMDEAILDNSGVINISNTIDEAIALEGEDNEGTLTNQFCGIINVSGAIISLSGDDNVLINLGIITSDTGGNQNDGTFTNDGVIHAPDGVFDVDEILDGTGTVIDGPIPAVQSLCFVAIPTLSQWSLIILGLLILSIALINIKNEERVRNVKVHNRQR